MRIIPRSEWGAAAPTKTSTMPDSSIGWIVHYNGPPVPEQLSGKQLMQSVQRYHMGTKGWRDFAYSFGIDQDGNIFEGRGWFVVGGHTSGRFLGAKNGPSNNSHAHAVIFLIGQGQAPSQAALDAFAWLVAQGTKKGVPLRTTPHTVAAPGLHTSCPGPELTAITKSGYFLDTKKEAGTAMKEVVRQLYISLLGREPDESGWAHWTKVLEEKAITVDGVRWEFIAVRLAADAARFDALTARLSGVTAGGVDPKVVADEAFRSFIDTLIAMSVKAE